MVSPRSMGCCIRACSSAAILGGFRKKNSFSRKGAARMHAPRVALLVVIILAAPRIRGRVHVNHPYLYPLAREQIRSITDLIPAGRLRGGTSQDIDSYDVSFPNISRREKVQASRSSDAVIGLDSIRRVPDSELSEPANVDAFDPTPRRQPMPKKRSKSNRKLVKKGGKASVMKAISIDEFTMKVQRQNDGCQGADNTSLFCTLNESVSINASSPELAHELGSSSSSRPTEYDPLSQSEYLALPSVITWMLPATEERFQSQFETLSHNRGWTQEQIRHAIQKVQLWKTLLLHHNISELRNQTSLCKTLTRAYQKLNISQGVPRRRVTIAMLPSMVSWMPPGPKGTGPLTAFGAPTRQTTSRNGLPLKGVFGRVSSWSKQTLSGRMDARARGNETLSPAHAWMLPAANSAVGCLPLLALPSLGWAGASHKVGGDSMPPSMVGWMPINTRATDRSAGSNWGREALQLWHAYTSRGVLRFGAEELGERLARSSRDCARLFHDFECLPMKTPTRAQPWRSLPSVVTWATMAKGLQEKLCKPPLMRSHNKADRLKKPKKGRPMRASKRDTEAKAPLLAEGGERRKAKTPRVSLKPSMVTWMPTKAHRGQLLVVLGLISREWRLRRKAAKKWLRQFSLPDLAAGSTLAPEEAWTARPSVVTWAWGLKRQMPAGSTDEFVHEMADCRVCRAGEARSAQHRAGGGGTMKPSMVGWMPTPTRASPASFQLAHLAEAALELWRPIARDALSLCEGILNGQGPSGLSRSCCMPGIPTRQDDTAKQLAEALEAAVEDELEGRPLPAQIAEDDELTGVELPHGHARLWAADGELRASQGVGRSVTVIPDGEHAEVEEDGLSLQPAEKEADARMAPLPAADENASSSRNICDDNSAASATPVSADVPTPVVEGSQVGSAEREPLGAVGGRGAAALRRASPKKRSRSNRNQGKRSGKASVFKTVSVDEFNEMMGGEDRDLDSAAHDCAAVSADNRQCAQGARHAEKSEAGGQPQQVLKERQYGTWPSVVTWLQPRKDQAIFEAREAAQAWPRQDGSASGATQARFAEQGPKDGEKAIHQAQQYGDDVDAPASPPSGVAADLSLTSYSTAETACDEPVACSPLGDLFSLASWSASMTSAWDAGDRMRRHGAAAGQAASRLSRECSHRICTFAERTLELHNEHAARWLAATSMYLKPLPCLHSLATREQRGEWAREAAERVQRARQAQLVVEHRKLCGDRDRLQRIGATKEDAWRRSSAQVQHDAWHRCWRRRQAKVRSLAANRQAALDRDTWQRREVLQQDADRELMRKQQVHARTRACVEANRAAASATQCRYLEELSDREQVRRELSNAQGQACYEVRRAQETEAARRALLAEHRLSAVERGRAKSAEAHALDAERKAVSERQQTSFAEACAREEQQQRLDRRLALHLQSRRDRQRRQRREAVAIEDSRRGASEEQQSRLDEALQRLARVAREKELKAEHRACAAAHDAAQRHQAAWQEVWRHNEAGRQVRVWQEVREHVARRLEIRQVALVSRHRLWGEKREAAARKAASIQEGGNGVRGKIAQKQERHREVRGREVQEEERERARAERAAREDALKQAHILAREEHEYLERQRIIEMIWALREVAVRQEEACLEAQRLKAQAERLEAEAAAREAADVAVNKECCRERDAVLRADVLESDWARRATSVEQEAAWIRVWRAEAEECARRCAQEEALKGANRLAGNEREQARCEAALEAAWAYKAQAIEQEARRAEVSKIEEAAAAAARRKQADEARRNRELEHLWKCDSWARERELREEVMEHDWARRSVAARQKDAWRQSRARVEEVSGAAQVRPEPVAAPAREAVDEVVVENVSQKQRRTGEIGMGSDEEEMEEEEQQEGSQAISKDDRHDAGSECEEEEHGGEESEEDRKRREAEAEEDTGSCVGEGMIRLEQTKRDEREVAEEQDRKREAMRAEDEAGKKRVRDAMTRLGRVQRDEQMAADDLKRRQDAEREEDEASKRRVREAILRMQKAARDKRVVEEEAALREESRRAEEAASKLRVRQAVMRLEKEAFVKDGEQVHQREKRAQNRMHAYVRERMLRDEMEQDTEWRAAVSVAQEIRRRLADEWGRVASRKREEEKERQEQLDAMYRERERMQAEEALQTAVDAGRRGGDGTSQAASTQLQLERAEELEKREGEREAREERERKQVQEEYEKMRERAVAKALEEETTPRVFGADEADEEARHILMQEREQQRARVHDELLGEVLEFGAAADENLLMTDPKMDAKKDAKKHPHLERAEAEEARWTLPQDLEERLWADRERALEQLRDESPAPAPAPAHEATPLFPLPSTVTWMPVPRAVIDDGVWRPTAVEAGDGPDDPVSRGTPEAEGKGGEAARASNASLLGESFHTPDGAGSRNASSSVAVPRHELSGDVIQLVGKPEVAQVKPTYDDLVYDLLAHKAQARAELEDTSGKALGDAIVAAAAAAAADKNASSLSLEAAADQPHTNRSRVQARDMEHDAGGPHLTDALQGSNETGSTAAFAAQREGGSVEAGRGEKLDHPGAVEQVDPESAVPPTAAVSGERKYESLPSVVTWRLRLQAPASLKPVLEEVAVPRASAGLPRGRADETATSALGVGEGEMGRGLGDAMLLGANTEDDEQDMSADPGDANAMLWAAADIGDVEGLVVALGMGADTGSTSRLARTALHMAAIKGHTAIVEVLVDVGAAVDAVDEDSMTPLHLAAFYGQALVAVQLVERGADLVAASSQDTGALTPAEIAIEGGHKGTAKVLLDLLRTMRDAKFGRVHSPTPTPALRGSLSRHMLDSPTGGSEGSRESRHTPPIC